MVIDRIEAAGDGDTAGPAPKRWLLEGTAHDSMEDAILTKVDIERGHAFEIVKARWRPAVADERMKGVRVSIERGQIAQLDRFIERLVHIMASAPEDGGSSATRAYVIAKALQAKAQRTPSERIELLMSPEGARALGTELRAYLPKERAHDLSSLRDVILAAIAEREAGRRTRGRRNRRNGSR